jgi:hypothetical protein
MVSENEYKTRAKSPLKGRKMQQQIEQQVKVGFGHIAKGLSIMAEALMAAGLGQDPQPQHQDPVATGNATTARAKRNADKKAPAAAPAPEKAPETTQAPQGEEQAAEVTQEAAPAPAPAKSAAAKPKATKAAEPEFETLDREGQIEHLRGRMVMVAQKLNGDREKVYAFLKKYKAQKVNELSDENLGNLKADIEVFLAGPDALDI